MRTLTPSGALKLVLPGLLQMDRHFYPMTLSTQEKARIVLAAIRGDLGRVVDKIKKTRAPRRPIQDWVGY